MFSFSFVWQEKVLSNRSSKFENNGIIFRGSTTELIEIFDKIATNIVLNNSTFHKYLIISH